MTEGIPGKMSEQIPGGIRGAIPGGSPEETPGGIHVFFLLKEYLEDFLKEFLG